MAQRKKWQLSCRSTVTVGGDNVSAGSSVGNNGRSADGGDPNGNVGAGTNPLPNSSDVGARMGVSDSVASSHTDVGSGGSYNGRDTVDTVAPAIVETGESVCSTGNRSVGDDNMSRASVRSSPTSPLSPRRAPSVAASASPVSPFAAGTQRVSSLTATDVWQGRCNVCSRVHVIVRYSMSFSRWIVPMEI